MPVQADPTNGNRIPRRFPAGLSANRSSDDRDSGSNVLIAGETKINKILRPQHKRDDGSYEVIAIEAPAAGGRSHLGLQQLEQAGDKPLIISGSGSRPVQGSLRIAIHQRPDTH